MKIHFLNLILVTLMLLAPFSSSLAEIPIVRAETATIKTNSNWSLPGETKTVNFDFSAGEVWLRSNGEWKVSGWVRHAGVLCGKYSVAIQFGIGAPNCINVDWKNDPQFSPSRKQCNNAIQKHLNIEKTPVLVKDFKKITCARRLVKCKGNCKGSSGTFTNKP